MTEREKGNEQDRGIKVRILVDIRAAFARNGDPLLLATEALLHTLNADPEAPWREHGSDGLTARKLQILLRDYEVGSANRRFPDGTQRRGYARADFTDAWNRYCPEPDPVTSVAPGAHSELPLAEVERSAAEARPRPSPPPVVQHRVPGSGLPPASSVPGTGPRR